MSIFTNLEPVQSISESEVISEVISDVIYRIDNVDLHEKLYSNISPESFNEIIFGEKHGEIPLTIPTISKYEDIVNFNKMTDYLNKEERIQNNEERIQNNDILSSSIKILPISKNDKFKKIPLYSISKKKKITSDSNIRITSKNLSRDDIIYIGIYTRAERLLKIKRFRSKKRNLPYKYECRRKFAKNRPREGGRFIPIS